MLWIVRAAAVRGVAWVSLLADGGTEFQVAADGSPGNGAGRARTRPVPRLPFVQAASERYGCSASEGRQGQCSRCLAYSYGLVCGSLGGVAGEPRGPSCRARLKLWDVRVWAAGIGQLVSPVLARWHPRSAKWPGAAVQLIAVGTRDDLQETGSPRTPRRHAADIDPPTGLCCRRRASAAGPVHPAGTGHTHPYTASAKRYAASSPVHPQGPTRASVHLDTTSPPGHTFHWYTSLRRCPPTVPL